MRAHVFFTVHDLSGSLENDEFSHMHLTRSSIILQDYSHLFVKSKYSKAAASNHAPFTIAQVVACFDMKLKDAAVELGWPGTTFKKILRQMGIQSWPQRARKKATARKTGQSAAGKDRSLQSRRNDQMHSYIPTFRPFNTAPSLHTAALKHAQIVAWKNGSDQTNPAATTISILGDSYGVFPQAQDEENSTLDPRLLDEMRIMDEVYDAFTMQGGASWT
jgi:hypothetical protein